MAAVTFPDPAANNPATGAPYGDGWYNPANGVTYKFENNVWSALTEPNTSLDDRYVEVAGDNMTGDLTLGTDKITLNATDGSADFAKSTTVGLGTGTVKANNGGYLFIRPRTANGVALDIYNSNDDAAATIKGDGSATFAGNVDVGNYPTTGSRRTNSGAIILNRADSDSSEVFLGKFLGTETSRINADGSAKFAGTVEQNSTITRSVIIQTEPDNAAHYTTTTDAEGNETQVYNGPTLDVKEKLQEALATIADLQTRIAALEAA